MRGTAAVVVRDADGAFRGVLVCSYFIAPFRHLPHVRALPEMLSGSHASYRTLQVRPVRSSYGFNEMLAATVITWILYGAGSVRDVRRIKVYVLS